MADAPSVLPALLLRNLGDKSYEKRKQAALDIEMRVKELNKTKDDAKSQEQITEIIKLLVTNFAYSTQSYHRRGGLIALAATAIALNDDTNTYLTDLLPPILQCFKDGEPRVRYYACESMYNISKVARGTVLQFFNEIFDGLCALYQDPNGDVRNGAQLLDRLLKDIVTESESFDVEKFIPLLRERIMIQNPALRQLLVGWITVLDSVPDIDMLEFLPEYLAGLFHMLSDSQKDIRQQANAALDEFLREITQSPTVELGPMVGILVQQGCSADNFTRLSALNWLYEFIQLGQEKLLQFCADILSVVLHCISDAEEEIRSRASATDASLLSLVEKTNEKFDIPPLLDQLKAQIRNKWVSTRLASLKWVNMLLIKMPATIYDHLDDFFPALLSTLSDPDEAVVSLDLKVMARIALDAKNFDRVLNSLLNLFGENRTLLATRGSLIIRQLSVLLDGESIFRAFGRLLVEQEDLEFTSLMIQTLNLILLTSAELFNLRRMIKNSLVTPKGRDLFIDLYKSWCFNPVATFSLCLLAQAYELAAALIFKIADLEVTVGLLMQVDKLVQLIESPLFIHVRLQLLEPNRHPFLVKSLYGLLMLLPQSTAFVSLKSRLSSVAPLGQLNLPTSQFAKSSSPEEKIKETKALDFSLLLGLFSTTQARYSTMRKEVYRQHRLTAKGTVALDEQKDDK